MATLSGADLARSFLKLYAAIVEASLSKDTDAYLDVEFFEVDETNVPPALQNAMSGYNTLKLGNAALARDRVESPVDNKADRALVNMMATNLCLDHLPQTIRQCLQEHQATTPVMVNLAAVSRFMDGMKSR